MNKKISMTMGIVVLMAVSFYGGMQYGGNNVRAAMQSRGQNFGMSKMRGGMRNGMGKILGEILSKDAQSITLKMQDGGSKIIFYTDATKVSKTVTGASTDLAVGASVSVTGTANSDGSVSATELQMRSVLPTPTSTN